MLRSAASEIESEDAIPSPSLHACMVGLVLLNLVFVQLTEAASLAWLAPLYVLTLTSSFFARFKERFVYRSLWNLGVLGFFTLLLRHAMSADLAFVLQDGLTLAALCQVHLLNNLHRDQRPDLLFLNSYLIAIITGYITVDLGFAGAFLAYVPFYVLGLQFLSIFRPDRRLTRAEARAVAFDGAKRSFVLLGLALAVFVFWPRDFQREALLSRYFEFSPNDAQAKVDFSESLELGERGGADADLGRVVMTISPAGSPVENLPSLWRGTTLGQHLRDGSWAKLKGPVAQMDTGDASWRAGPTDRSVVRPVRDLAGDLEPGDASGEEQAIEEPQRVRVTRAGGSTRVLFMPQDTAMAELGPQHSQGIFQAERDGTLRYSNPGELRYELLLSPIESSGAPDPRAFLKLNPSIHTSTAADLAAKLRERLPDEASAPEIADRFSSYLRDRYPYRLPASGKGEEGADGPADTLHAFLTSERGGHCEFFASALATMLRSQEIPSRVVTGFRVGDRDPETGMWTVRSTSAHAWVEAWLEGEWVTFDPTPAADPDAEGEGWIDRANAALVALWTRVTTFDAESRAILTAWVQAAPGRFLSLCRAHPTASVGVATLLGLVIAFLRKRRREKTPASIRALRATMRSAKVELEIGETPRALLGRVEAMGELDVESVKSLRKAVNEHERERFAAPRP
ncbi:Protein-glutamine gamma-glutamyltransferase [Planctomycetes bacterium Poly30]|uniref:Protein-glutamine gamma-glutamyltransferase n=1 Tax=Saltatorellus ferox TaxID=2528018 RepID=A0A518ENS3_9BACT|nr:Protein-glutamine gamma-glutamyltransferase [Planctomycetes bacterium Poly30]